jgi:hypothetical protein
MANWRYTDDTNTVVYAEFEDGHSESHLVTADCIQAWLAKGNTPLPYEPPEVDAQAEAKAELRESDSGMARVAEDLIQTLLSKGVIAESDIPAPARSKLDRRAELRSKLHNAASLLQP